MQKLFFVSLLHLFLVFSFSHADMTAMKKQAFADAKFKAEKGDANAQFSLGGIYYQGIVAEKNYAKAIEWFTKAAEQGHTKAEYNLGYIYYDGRGVPVNYKKAYDWFKLAAERGDMKAELYLAQMYYDGKGVEQNYKEAFSLYKKLADKGGYPEAQQKVGHMFRKGLGIKKSKAMARFYLDRASRQSLGEAQYELGNMYIADGGKAAMKEAKKLMQKAYLNGVEAAKEVLDQHDWETIKDSRSMPLE